MAEDGVEDEGLDLLLRGGEAVEGVVDFVVEDLVLDADGDLDEDVVVGLGLDLKLGLLDLEVDEVDSLGEGEEEVRAGAGDAVELAEALDYAGGEGADLVVGFGDEDEDKDGNYEDEDEDSRHACALSRYRGRIYPAAFGAWMWVALLLLPPSPRSMTNPCKSLKAGWLSIKVSPLPVSAKT